MNYRPNVHLWGAAVLLAVVCAGCNAGTAAPDPHSGSSSASAPRFGQTAPPRIVADEPPVAPEPSKDDVKPVETTVSQETSSAPAPLPLPSSATDKKVQTSSNAKPAEPKRETSAAESYDAKKPSLMGIRLTDTKQTVKQKFEAPANEYEMDDDKDPITVFEYDGFTVGFNATSVEFIEITSGDVNPGLNGLRLGQKVKDAETALGKPD
ncbi:hypothetical protein, partial [Paenibacillus sp. GYB003]|uniref:hypothetical protein n=1 Tax=Paenibacillus sp. GYB003 TaxID=2994392 RepID=UPI002F96CC3F